MENKEPTPAELLKMFAEGAKIRKVEWHPDTYVYLKNSIIYDDKGFVYDMSVTSLLNESWEIYKKPKKLKRFWLWDINKDGWYRASTYLDENGVCTDNIGCLQELWHSLEKRKAEPEQYIDVEVSE